MDIQAKELLAQIKRGSPPVIVDVRSAQEFAAGHVPGAMHLPFWSALFRSGRIRTTPDAPIVIYCGHGPRAEMAARALRFRGFRNLRYLRGHMAEWERQGLPIEK